MHVLGLSKQMAWDGSMALWRCPAYSALQKRERGIRCVPNRNSLIDSVENTTTDVERDVRIVSAWIITSMHFLSRYQRNKSNTIWVSICPNTFNFHCKIVPKTGLQSLYTFFTPMWHDVTAQMCGKTQYEGISWWYSKEEIWYIHSTKFKSSSSQIHKQAINSRLHFCKEHIPSKNNTARPSSDCHGVHKTRSSASSTRGSSWLPEIPVRNPVFD